MENRSESLAASGAGQAEAFVGGLQWAFVVGAVIGIVVVVLSLLLPARVEAPEGAPVGH